MKKLFLVVGCLAGMLTLRAAEELVSGVIWHYEETGGYARIVEGDPAYAGDLVVPDELGGYPVTEIAHFAFTSNPDVTSVSLPRGVTNVGIHTFCYCTALTNVTSRAPFIHYGESSLSCSGLLSFVVPEGETYLDLDLFQNSASLVSVTLPSTLLRIGRSTFYGCSSLKEIRFPACFESFGEYWWEQHWPFYACTGLTDAYFLGGLPANFNLSGLLALTCRIHYPRAHAAEWEAVVPADRFGGYTDEPDSGEGTGPDAPGGTGDAEPTVPDGIYSGVVDGVAWRYRVTNGAATVITGEPAYAGDLVVPDELGGYPVTEIAHMAFTSNPDVTSVSLPRGVTNVGIHTFCYCTALTNVTSRAPFIHYGESSLSCSGLLSFVVPEGETYLDLDLFQNSASLVSVTLPSTLLRIGRSTFYGCSSLKEIRFPACFESFGEYWWEQHWPFYACTGLTDVYFLGGLPANFEYSGLLALTCRIHYPRAHAAEWETVVPADRFGGYTDEPDPAVPDGIYSSVVDGVAWRYQVTNGAATVITGEPAYAGDLFVPDELGGCPVTGIAHMAFTSNPDVTSVSLPRGVTNVGIHTFCNCSALTNVMSRAAFIHYGESSLSGSALTRFVVPEGETRLEPAIFQNDASLVSVSLPSTLRTMGRSCFYGCSSLTEIRFPACFEKFEGRSPAGEQRAFAHCTGLEHSYFFGHVPENFDMSGLLDYGLVHYPRAYAAEWRAVVPQDRFGGYSDGELEPRPACVAGIAGYSGIYDGIGHGISVSDVSPATATLSYALTEDGPYGSAAPLFTNICNCVVWCRVEAPGYLPATIFAPVVIRPGALGPTDPSEPGPDTFPVIAFDGVYDGEGHSVVAGAEGMDVVYALREEDLRAGLHAPVPPVFTNVIDATVWYQVSSSNYMPFVSNATVRIAPRPVTLSSRGGWKKYDGTPLVRDGVSIGGMGFVPGEGVEVHVTGAQTEIGTSDNVFEWNPLPGTVTSNYEIAVSYGKLRVTKGPEGTVILIRGPAVSVR